MSAAATTGLAGASGFARRVLARQALVGAAAFGTVGVLVPWTLALEQEVLGALGATGFCLAALALVLTGLVSAQRLRGHRYVLRSLALGSTAVEPEDIGALARLPFALTARFVACGALCAGLVLVPALRPAELDNARALSLCAFVLTIVCASAVVHYVVVRQATTSAIELSPLDPITVWLEQEASSTGGPRRRVTQRILVAIVAPVVMVGVGALLVTRAHIEAFAERSRTATAVLLARTALQPGSGAVPAAGRDDALRAAAMHGFVARIERGARARPMARETGARRDPSGELRLSVPLDDGMAAMRFFPSVGWRAV
ncbi:MAG: hypothetical protein HY744_27065, partial [Deltaproteobacteria bacterium]|nr:hypothetical protein [Deltaproteobacteria bacterium]